MTILSVALARLRAQTLLSPLLALLAILLLTALVYMPSLDDWFIYHDYIHLGAASTHSAGDFAKRVLDPGDGGESLFNTGKLYRPTYYLTMLAEQRAFGLDNTFPYHLVNLSMHLLNIVLVWLIARKLTRSLLPSYVAALVYGLHPVYFDAVNWISAITEVLLATFSLAAIYLFIRSLEERGGLSGLFYLGSFVSAVLALGSREPGASLFFVLPAYYFLVHAPQDWRRPRAWLRFVPFFAVAAAYALMRFSVTRAVASGEGGNAVGTVGWHMFTNVFLFNGWTLVPILSDLGRWLPVVMGAAAILLMRVHERFFFHGGGAGRFVVLWWYAVAFTYSTAGWIRPLLAGRYLYMASAAFAILSGMFVVWLIDRLPIWLQALPGWRPSLAPVLRAVLPVAIVIAVIPPLAWGTLHHQGSMAETGRDSQALLTQLRETYPSLPAGSTLYVVDAPPALLFAGGPFFMTPAVQWYYPDVDTKVVAEDEVAQIASSMGDDDRILFFERE